MFKNHQLNFMEKYEKAYVLYLTKNYLPIVELSIDSIQEFSNIPILVYTLNFKHNFKKLNVFSIEWNCDIEELNTENFIKDDGNFFIKREEPKFYKVLIQRSLVIKHALENFSNLVCYVDSDSIATPWVDKIFNYFPENSQYPYLTLGIYDFFSLNGRGLSSPFSWKKTLEHPVCELLKIDQTVRRNYRQTGYIVAGQNSIKFLEEWYNLSNNLEVLKNPSYYAPYHEETIINALFWKCDFHKSLPLVYVNGSLKDLPEVFNDENYNGVKKHVRNWFILPEKKEYVHFIHGEKNTKVMMEMISEIKKINKKKVKILYLAPHLSTGGMPAFLLKRIHALSNAPVEIIVVEYANLSDEYVVHKKQIKELSDHFYTLHEDKVQLLEIIKKHEIDVVHIEEMAEDSVTNFSIEMLNFLYDNGRTWNIVETCHNVLFNPDVEKKYHPDAYVFCTSYHYTTFERMPSSKFLIEYPIEKIVQSNNIKKVSMEFLSLNPDKIHVLNVGLWTPGKNQKEGVEIAREFPDVEFHFVGNQAVNFKNYWEPIMKDLPKNVHVWGEKFHVDVFMSACDIFMFNSTWECNPLVLREAASQNMPILARNLSQYEDMFNGYILPFDNGNKLEKMQELLDGWKPTRIPQSSAMFDFKVNHLYVYNEVMKGSKTVQEIDFNIHFVKQPFFEIKGPSKSDFLIKFIDTNDVVIYENTIKTNSWIKLNRRWFTNWKIKVWENNNFILEYNLDFKDKRVFITIESSSLGDNIAWMPYLEKFRKKHECTLIVSTFKNFLFEKSYPDIEFVSPGSVVHNLQGMYSIGWFYDLDKEPTLPNVIPLQKTATNILGLEYQEIKPLISFEPLNVPIQEKYITIATNSTAGCKFWTKEGWQEVINYLFEKGYRVINVSLEDNPFENCTSLEDKSINNVMNYIHHSEFFIGLSSGLSWLAWALNKKVVMISNFSEANHEFDCFRVVKKTVCNGCWNNPEYKFDKSWNWCPEHAGTDRQFECQTSISGEDIISLLNQKLLT